MKTLLFIAAIEPGLPKMNISSWIIIGIILACCFAAYGFFDYARTFNFNDETPEQRKEKDEEIVRVLTGSFGTKAAERPDRTSTSLIDRRKEGKVVKVGKVFKDNQDDTGNAPDGGR